MDNLKSNPLTGSYWKQLTYANSYDKFIYDSKNNIYYGIIKITNGTGIKIYKITEDIEEELISYEYSIVDGFGAVAVVDAIFSIYKNSIIILLACNDEAEENQNNYAYIDEYYPDSNTFKHDIIGYYQRLNNVGRSVITDWGVTTINVNMSRPHNISIVNNILFLLCGSPNYCLFAYDISNNSSEIPSKFVHYFDYDIGDWEDYYGISCRNEHYTEIINNVSISETENYIALCITERIYDIDAVSMAEASSGYYWYFTHTLLVNKSTIEYSEIALNYFNSPVDGMASYNNNFYLYTNAISCCDYNNDKFLVCSGATPNTKAKIIELDAKSGEYNGIEAGYSECYRVLELAGTICTLYLKASKIYIKSGYDFSTITNTSTYTALDNVACDSNPSTCSIMESVNQLNYSHKSLIFIVDKISSISSDTSYGFIGENCLPLIDEEGMNAFIKIKN